MRAFDPREATIFDPTPGGVARMQGEARSGGVRHQMRHAPRARHRVPLVAYAAGVERERVIGEPLVARRREREHACATDRESGSRRARRGAVPTGQGPVSGKAIARARTRHRLRHRARPARRYRRRGAPSFSNADSAACSRKMSAGPHRRKRLLPAHAPRHLREHPPIRPRLAGRRAEGALARDAPLGIGDGAVLLGPARRRQNDMGERGSVGRPGVGDDRQAGSLRQRLAHDVRRAACCRPDWCAAIHIALMRAVRDGLEQIDRLEARPRRDRAARSRTGARGRRRRARSPYARRVGWRGRRPRARPSRWAGRSARTAPCPAADAPGGQMAVEDGVDLVGPAARTG